MAPKKKTSSGAATPKQRAGSVASPAPDDHDDTTASASSSTGSRLPEGASEFARLRADFRTGLLALLADLKSRRTTTSAGYSEREVAALVQALMVRLGSPAKDGSVLVEEEAWRKDVRRVVVDRGLEECLLDQVTDDAEPFADLCDLLDIILTFAELDYADPNLPLSCLSTLLPLINIAGCRLIFSYVTLRVDRLTKDMEPQRGKGPLLLRLLNELLRRLPKSKTEDVVFSGRILMFLSSVFPLGEMSGVNLRGNFNTGKGTVWEEAPDKAPDDEQVKMEVEEGAEVELTPEEFYSTFWSLQRIFNNPPLLFAPSSTEFATLRSSTVAILDRFSAATRSEKELVGAAREDKGKAAVVESEQEVIEHYFFPKFLTSRNLLDLEVADPAFRRQILIQTLILFQYLLGFTEAQRAKVALLPVSNQSALLSYVLSPEHETWIEELKKKVLTEMQNMEGGKQFRHTVELILRRDQNWINWKLRNCPTFAKPSILEPQTPPIKVSSAGARTKLAQLARKPKAYQNRLGNPTLSRLWTRNTTTLEGCKPDRRSAEDVDALFRQYQIAERKVKQKQALKAQLVEGKSSTLFEVERELDALQNQLSAIHWRAFRAASATNLKFFYQAGNGDLHKLMGLIEKSRMSQEEVEEAEADDAQMEGEGKEEDMAAEGGDAIGSSLPPTEDLDSKSSQPTAPVSLLSPKRPRDGEDVEMAEGAAAKKLKTEEEP